jgi:hypothetical protein
MRIHLAGAAGFLKRARGVIGETLTGGNLTLGFYGEIPAANFITGDLLATKIGMAAGAGAKRYSNEPWLKFAYQGKTLYVAKKHVRVAITWDSLNGLGSVFGQKTVVIGDKTYKVRILTGNAGFEFDKLFERVHRSGTVTPKFADYLAEDLDMGPIYSLCQETVTLSTWSAIRNNIPSGVSTQPKNTTGTNVGWRPVLELVV